MADCSAADVISDFLASIGDVGDVEAESEGLAAEGAVAVTGEPRAGSSPGERAFGNAEARPAAADAGAASEWAWAAVEPQPLEDAAASTAERGAAACASPITAGGGNAIEGVEVVGAAAATLHDEAADIGSVVADNGEPRSGSSPAGYCTAEGTVAILGEPLAGSSPVEHAVGHAEVRPAAAAAGVAVGWDQAEVAPSLREDAAWVPVECGAAVCASPTAAGRLTSWVPHAISRTALADIQRYTSSASPRDGDAIEGAEPVEAAVTLTHGAAVGSGSFLAGGGETRSGSSPTAHCLARASAAVPGESRSDSSPVAFYSDEGSAAYSGEPRIGSSPVAVCPAEGSAAGSGEPRSGSSPVVVYIAEGTGLFG